MVGLTVFLISKTFGWTDCISKMNQKNHCACTISDFRFLGMKQIQAIIQAIIQDNGICSLVDRSDESVVQSWFLIKS